MIAILVLVVLLVLVIGYLVGIYNGLIRVRADVKLAWSNIDVLLVQRHDELPKLVETCKQYLQYEQQTLERVMQARSAVAAARSSGSVAALGAAESGMRSGLAGLFAVAENYPDQGQPGLPAPATTHHRPGAGDPRTGARSITRPSTSTTCASRHFPTYCWQLVMILNRRACSNSILPRKPIST